MDLGNYEIKVFGLTIKQMICFLIAGLATYIFVRIYWEEPVSFYMPFITIVFGIAYFISSVKIQGVPFTRFLLIIFRNYFLVPKKRQNMTAMQYQSKKDFLEDVMKTKETKHEENTDNILDELNNYNLPDEEDEAAVQTPKKKNAFGGR
jgi:hypothetical protein